MKKHIQQAVKEIMSQYDRIDPEYFNKKKGRYNYNESKIYKRKDVTASKRGSSNDRS